MAGVIAEARAVDQALRVLDAKADRKRLGLEAHAALLQHREGVTRAVAEGQHHVFGVQLFATGELHAAHLAAFDVQVGHLLAEAHLAAQRLDARAHLLDHAHQPEGADVRLGDVEDLRRRAGLDELVQDLARQVARIADLAPQLAVGKGAGTALAELHIRLGVEQALAPQPPGVAGAFAHRAAAFQHDRAQAHLRQHQRGEQAARAESDHHRARPIGRPEVARRMADPPVAGVGRRAHLRRSRQGRQHACFVDVVGEFAVDAVDQLRGRSAACVPGAAHHAETLQCRVVDLQPLDDGLAQRRFRVVQRQAKLGDAQHRRSRSACVAGRAARAAPHADQPPFLARLPAFFLLRVCEPRSRLMRWPLRGVTVTPAGAGGRGVALRSASVMILLPMAGFR